MRRKPWMLWTWTLAAAALLVVGIDARAGTAERPLLSRGSDVGFTFRQMGVPVQGHFGRYGGHIALDAAHPEMSSVEMQVDVASVSVNADADPELVKPTWLDAPGHPQARFVSKGIQALGGGRYQATGTLSIKGIGREVTVPFEWRETAGGGAEVRGQFRIPRADYRVGEGEWSAFDVVANEVLISFHLLLGPAAGSQH